MTKLAVAPDLSLRTAGSTMTRQPVEEMSLDDTTELYGGSDVDFYEASTSSALIGADPSVVPITAGFAVCAACFAASHKPPMFYDLALACTVTPAVQLTPEDLGPRDLSECPIYDANTPGLEDLDALPPSIFAQAYINEIPVAAVIDTGATLTLISGTLYDAIPADRRPGLRPTTVDFSSANGSQSFEIRGSAIMAVAIADTTGLLYVTVCDNLWAQCLIGRDFMIRYQVTPCMIDLVVKSRAGTTPFRTFYATRRGGRIVFVRASHTHVPAFTVEAASANRVWVACPPALVGRTILVEPSPRAAASGIVAARTIINAVDGRIPVQFLNLSQTRFLIREHDELATATDQFDIDEAVECRRAEPTTKGGSASTQFTVECTADAERVIGQLDLTGSVFAEGQPDHDEFVEFLNEYQDMFARHADDYGRTTLLEHEIVTDPQAAPIYQRPRPVPIHYRNQVREEIDGMVRAGIVAPSTSEWSSPIVIVKKKDGGIRLCVDYRALNNVTIKDSFPLPRISELLESLHGASLFSSLDLQKGFHQISMEAKSRCKTAFAVPWGLFEFAVMPFGVCNGPGTFQRLVTLALNETLGTDCLAYIDDILIPATSPAAMIAKLRRVFGKLRTAGLKVKPQKCKFGAEAIDFLGHRVDGNGIRMLDDKVTKILNVPPPSNITELRAFLGLTNYYRDYIGHYAEIASPLYELLKKGVTWRWLDEQNRAFNEVKEAFMDADGLAHPNSTDLFILDTDASLDGIGGVLSQVQDGRERIICCASRVLTPAERNYDTTRRELLAVVTFCLRFKHYLYGAMFVLRTDHSALRWLFHSFETSAQSMRWITKLADFPMLVVHRPGHLHSNADALSRRPLLLSEGQLTEVDDDQLPESLASTRQVATVAAVLTHYGTAPESATLNDLLDQPADAILAEAINCVRDQKWPDRQTMPSKHREFRALHAVRERLQLVDGYLCYRRRQSTDDRLPYVAPRIARSSIIAECHDAKSAAHFAERKTADTIRKRFWWPALKADVRLYCRLCSTCQMCAKRQQPIHAPMQMFQAGAPWEVVGVDFVGPVPATKHNHRYILTIVDHFSRLTVLVPLKNQSAQATINAIVDRWIAYYGVPLVIHSDRGSNFTSDVVTSVCDRLGVRRTRTTAYRPQADGRVERVNRTVKECLIRLTHEYGQDWDELLPQVSMAINSSVHESTGYSPFFLAHGTDMQLPIDLACPIPTVQYATADEFVDQLLRRLDNAYDLAQRTMRRQILRSKKRYDAAARTIRFLTGDQVYYLKAVPSANDHRKFFAPWLGPFTVVEVLGDVNVKIRHNEQGWERVVHIDRLSRKPTDPDDERSADEDDGQAPDTSESDAQSDEPQRTVASRTVHSNYGLRNRITHSGDTVDGAVSSDRQRIQHGEDRGSRCITIPIIRPRSTVTRE